MKLCLAIVLICFCVTILIIPCCSYEKKSEVKTVKSVILDSIEVYNPFEVNFNQDYNKYKFHIISYLNVSCSVCIAEIEKWNDFYKKANNKNFDIKLIFYAEDKFQYIKYLIEKGDIKPFPFPFYLEYKKTFLIQNPIFNINTTDKTILIDNKNIVRMTGNPIHSNEITSKYLNALTNQ